MSLRQLLRLFHENSVSKYLFQKYSSPGDQMVALPLDLIPVLKLIPLLPKSHVISCVRPWLRATTKTFYYRPG